MVGVRHLHSRAVALYFARNDAGFVKRQKPPHLVAVSMEEDDIQRAGFILADDAKRRSRRAFGRRIVTHGRDGERCDVSRLGFFYSRREAPGHIAGRQMPKKVENARRRQRLRQKLRKKLLAARSQTFERPQRRKQIMKPSGVALLMGKGRLQF